MDPRLPVLLFGSFGVLLFLSFPIAAALGISSVLVIAPLSTRLRSEYQRS